MTESEIAVLLTESFPTQTRLYGELQELNLRCGELVAAGKKPQELLPILKSKKEKLEAIAAQDARIQSAKQEWQNTKDQWADQCRKEEVSSLLGELTTAVASVIQSEKALEELLRAPSPTGKRSAAGEYGKQSGLGRP